MTVYKAFKPEASKAADLAIQFAKGEDPEGETTVETAGGASVQSTLLDPVAVTTDNVQSTVVKDGLYQVDQICTSQYASACAAAGIE